jgi:hypothetical protein
VATYLKSEPSSGKRSLEVFRAVNKKHGGFDIVFLTQFAQENFCEGGCSRRKEPDVKQFVRLRIGGGVQPVLLIVDPNHRFVERNLIRRFPGFRLYIGLLNPIVDGFSTPLDTQLIEQFDGIRQ